MELQISMHYIQLCPALFTIALIMCLTLCRIYSGTFVARLCSERCGATAALTEQKRHKKHWVINFQRCAEGRLSQPGSAAFQQGCTTLSSAAPQLNA